MLFVAPARPPETARPPAASLPEIPPLREPPPMPAYAPADALAKLRTLVDADQPLRARLASRRLELAELEKSADIAGIGENISAATALEVEVAAIERRLARLRLDARQLMKCAAPALGSMQSELEKIVAGRLARVEAEAAKGFARYIPAGRIQAVLSMMPAVAAERRTADVLRASNASGAFDWRRGPDGSDVVGDGADPLAVVKTVDALEVALAQAGEWAERPVKLELP